MFAVFTFQAANLAFRFGPPTRARDGGFFIFYTAFVVIRHVLLQLFVKLCYLG